MPDHTTTASQRQPHAVLDLPSRDWKALKIERLLDLAQRQSATLIYRVERTAT